MLPGWVWWGFRVPEDVDDPVAVTVFEELEAVDAAGEGCGIVELWRDS
jgi:hypothetical protein